MPRLDPLETLLLTAWPREAWQEVTVLVAVSGGADSIALLTALARLKTAGAGRLVAAHFNHQLRGAESDGDAQFVQQVCEELGVQLELGTPDTEQQLQLDSPGLESAAREIRYAFLTETAARLGARYVAVAHTADDQTETILQRILRGTGLAGLSGIPRTRRLSQATTLVRPLLDVHREQVLAYLASLGQSYREDASNRDIRFARNRIRHELLPLLRQDYQAGVDSALLRLGQLAGEAQQVIDSLTSPLLEQSWSNTVAGYQLSAAPLRDQPDYLVREVLLEAWRNQGWPEQAMGYAEWSLLAEMLLHNPPGTKRILPGRIEVERTREGLEFREQMPVQKQTEGRPPE